MTTRSFRATLLLLLPLLFILSQCKPKDPTPPIPKASSSPPSALPNPTAQTGSAGNCVGLGCEKKECIGLGCVDNAPKCIGMGCEKKDQEQSSTH